MGATQAGRASELRAARWIAAVTLAVYAAAWLLNRTVAGFSDPLWGRALVGVLVAGGMGATFWSRRAVERLPDMIRVLLYCVTFHDFALLAVNRLHVLQVMGTFLLLSGFLATASLMMTRPRQLRAYLVVVALLSIGVVGWVKRPAYPPAHFLLAIGCFVALADVAVRSHLATLVDLRAARAELLVDVERRRRAEEELRASESRARAFLAAVPDMLVRLGPGGVILATLERPRTALEQSIAAAAGTSLDRVLCAKDDSVAATVARVLEEGAIGTLAGTIEASSGPCHVEVRIARVDAGECLALVRDVTERRRLEEGIRVADRLAAIGTLASGVAHEVNNPLSYVLNNLTWLEHRLRDVAAAAEPPWGDQEWMRALAEARDGARRIQRIVRSLGDYAREGEDGFLATDLGECVRTALRLLETQLRHRVHLELAQGEIPRVRGNPTTLVQVLTNLVTNAVQALTADGRQDGRIRIRTRAEQGIVVLEVEDDGPGFGPAVADRLFDAFFTTKSPGEGTGLGLYVCQRLVTAMGGSITAVSPPAGGATFTVRLQPADPELPAPEPVRPSAVGARLGVPILVVDDDPMVGRSIARLLVGEDVTVVGSATEALESCRARDYGLILCDIMMPEVDGPGLQDALAVERPALARRMIFMTGGAFTESTRAFLASLGERWLEKPFALAELERVAAEVISGCPR